MEQNLNIKERRLNAQLEMIERLSQFVSDAKFSTPTDSMKILGFIKQQELIIKQGLDEISSELISLHSAKH